MVDICNKCMIIFSPQYPADGGVLFYAQTGIHGLQGCSLCSFWGGGREQINPFEKGSE